MDKLKEFQKYQFWVLLGVAMILPLVGWFMSRSGLVAAAEERTKKLDGLRSSLNASADDPNQDWAAKLAQINKVQEDQIRTAWMHLYAAQSELMTWPENIDPEAMALKDVELYRRGYKHEVEKIRQIVKPLDEISGELLDEPGRLVNLPDSLMPHPDYDWATAAPTAKEVRAAQEDLWLLSALLTSIASVNENATSQLDAPVREIVALMLRGGSPKSAGGARSTTGSGSPMGGMGGGMGGGPMAEMMKNMRAGADGGMGSGAGIGIEAVSFNPDDEMGEQVEDKDASKASSTPSGATGGGAGPAAGMPSDMMKSMMSNMGGGMGGSRSMTSTANMKRYVEEKTEWKTRGFYLEVIMDQRHVPHLMVALTNAEWPIRITRVHQADLNDETLASGSAGMPGMPPMGRGAAGGGMDMMKKMMAGAGSARPGLGARPMRTGPDADDDGPRPIGSGRPTPSRSEGGGRSDSMSALEDPMLVTVAIDGLFTIFNKPPEDKTAPPAGSQQQDAPPAAGQQLPVTPESTAPTSGDTTEQPVATDGTADPEAADPGEVKPEAATEVPEDSPEGEPSTTEGKGPPEPGDS